MFIRKEYWENGSESVNYLVSIISARNITSSLMFHLFLGLTSTS